MFAGSAAQREAAAATQKRARTMLRVAIIAGRQRKRLIVLEKVPPFAPIGRHVHGKLPHPPARNPADKVAERSKFPPLNIRYAMLSLKKHYVSSH
jgi:hypothetical protein